MYHRKWRMYHRRWRMYHRKWRMYHRKWRMYHRKWLNMSTSGRQILDVVQSVRLIVLESTCFHLRKDF